MSYLHPSDFLFAAHSLVVIAVALRVIMMRPATGIALSWLLLVTMLPFVGAVVYFMIGERRIGFQRERGIGDVRAEYKSIGDAETRERLTNVDWSRHPAAARGLDKLGRTVAGSLTVRSSSLKLVPDTLEALRAMARDVDGAKASVLMEFYIWNEGGAADEVLEAVIRAAKRGVSCRVLVDALGARPWWKSGQPQRLRAAGVELRAALPVGLYRSFVGRTDLRLHRKIVVVDGERAWTGSMNLVDPGYFKQDAGVGKWVDAMVRLEGAVVIMLAATMISDWILETQEPIRDVIERARLAPVKFQGSADIQVVPAGPGESGDGLLQMLLALINAAQSELVLTTPYLVPDESLLRALRGAAGRGVKVTVIVPERVDSFLTRYASRSYYESLLEMGAEIYLYRGGLLHTKSIMVDGAMSMFGTVNLDMRSLWLNYEVALFVYDDLFASELRALQQTYIEDSDRLDLSAWRERGFKEQFVENVLRLVSPLL